MYWTDMKDKDIKKEKVYKYIRKDLSLVKFNLTLKKYGIDETRYYLQYKDKEILNDNIFFLSRECYEVKRKPNIGELLTLKAGYEQQIRYDTEFCDYIINGGHYVVVTKITEDNKTCYKKLIF